MPLVTQKYQVSSICLLKKGKTLSQISEGLLGSRTIMPLEYETNKIDFHPIDCFYILETLCLKQAEYPKYMLCQEHWYWPFTVVSRVISKTPVMD